VRVFAVGNFELVALKIIAAIAPQLTSAGNVVSGFTEEEELLDLFCISLPAPDLAGGW
jgi:hypothetical protein